jgi:molybdate/tungstate transport system substrate-binding protein
MNRLLSLRFAGLLWSLGAWLALSVVACGGSAGARHTSIVVFNAGALALPLRQALDSFATRNRLSVAQENAGSVETVRKITELGRVPDVIALADTALFSQLLPGRLAGPVAVLGRTRLVLAYTPRSRFAAEVTAQNWTDVTTRPGVQVGRSDPALDPAGYRALLAMQLAERYYARPGLARRLEAAASVSNMRPKSADLVALLQTGNLDFAWEYESVARHLGLRFVSLPSEVNLGDPALTATYAQARVEISAPGPSTHGDGERQNRGRLLVRGAPIVFGAAVPKGAPHQEAGRGFITYLMSPEGRAIFAAYGLHSSASERAADTPKRGT